MQVANSVQPRPTSVTVICVLGIICSGLSLLGMMFKFLAIIVDPGVGLLFNIMFDLVVYGGFLTACILMLNLNYAGKVIYHIVSVIWFIYMCLMQLAFFGLVTVGFTFSGMAGDPGSVVAVGVLGIVEFIIFLFIVIPVVVFNFMLCSQNVAGCWKR